MRSSVISSTQTWLVAVLDDGAPHELTVTGAAAVPVLAPLSLAVLALGGALSIVGLVLRYAFGALTVAIAGLIGFLSGQVAFTAPVSAVASTVTAATGITGAEAVGALVEEVAAHAVAGPDVRAVGSAFRDRSVHPRHRAPLDAHGAPIRVGCRDPGRSGSRGTGIPPVRRDRLVGRPVARRRSDSRSHRRSHPRTPLDWAGPALSRRKQ